MKEIIIDGVNVAGCKYYHYKGCTANNFGKCDSCSEIYKNCYFKQLQRAKEENARLKEALEEIREIAEEHSTCASYDCPPMFKIINLIKESEIKESEIKYD